MSDDEKIDGGRALQDRVRGILSALNSDLYGKEEAVRLALLSAVAGESIFFLGPPGTAKSMISRRISCAFKDIDRDRDYFEYLMNEFSTPDEICGPVSLKKLNEDQYLRLTEGYLPEARVAFLDEIWKSGPAILNTLLTIINERKFHNGKVVQKVPLVSLAAASNELPEWGRGLEALWDRFILRVMVNPVSAEEDFFKVVDSPVQEEPEIGSQHQLTFGEVEAWQKSIDMVELGDDARKVITAIRKELERRNQALEEKEREAESWYVSDRRWKKIVRILKASAFLNGRDTVDLMDCSLIACCIWNTGRQQQQVDAIMEEILAEYGMDCSTTIEELRELLEEFTTPEQFDSLGQEIDSEVKSLQEFKAENEAPFAENAFANQRYRPILLKKIDDSIKELEDLKLELQKKRDGHGKKVPLPVAKGTGQVANVAVPTIGDKGPGGGTVFHCDGTMAYEMVGNLGRYDWQDAWQAAVNYSGGGFSDWWLPTKDELDLVYQNLRKPETVYWDDWYWSLSEGSDLDYHWAQCFGNGKQELQRYFNEYPICAVRAFCIAVTPMRIDVSPVGKERGPGGGLVFHIDGTTAYEVSGVLGDLGWQEAMQRAAGYRGGGFSDWRLPTKDELDQVYQNLRRPGKIDGDDWHWSSSPSGNSYRWTQCFGNGGQDDYGANRVFAVRAIRAFPIQPVHSST